MKGDTGTGTSRRRALLGGVNVAFFAVFEQVGARAGGIVITAIHI